MSATKPEPRPLYQALLKAQRSMTSINKNANNAFSGYHYVDADHMVRCTREHLLANGLLFAETGSELVMGDGNAVVCCTYTLSHVDTGDETIIVSQQFAEPRKGTPLDKAIAGARTVSIRDALRGLFNLPRDAKEPDAHDDTAYEPQPKPKKKPDANPDVTAKGTQLIGRAAVLDLVEWKEIDGRKRINKIAAEVGVKMDSNITMEDLAKIEQRLNEIIEQHPGCLKVENEQ